MARIVMPTGTSLRETDIYVKKVEEWLLAQTEINTVYAAVGGFSNAAADSNVAVMFITMKDKKDRGVRPEIGKVYTQQLFMDFARKQLAQFKPAKVILRDPSAAAFGGGGRGYKVEFTVTGPNWDKLVDATRLIQEEMKKNPDFVDIDSNYLSGMPEIQLVPNRTQAAYHGVSIQTIGTTINNLIGGTKVGTYNSDGHRYDIRMKMMPSQDVLDSVTQIPVANPRGNLIPLAKLVEKKEVESIQSISRLDRQRAISVYANLTPTGRQENAMQFVEDTTKKILEPGYMLVTSGASRDMKESMVSLGFALLMGIAVAYMILAAQFNSYLDPGTILLTLPLSILGALGALYVTGQTLNLYSLIGVLLLMGIVKKNSILLVEFTNHVRELRSSNALESLLYACPVRLRPILMTSFATMAAALPSAIATGSGSEAFKAMAICIIGGVFVSTFLTLYIVPCAYLISDRLRRRDTSRKKIAEAFKAVGAENP